MTDWRTALVAAGLTTVAFDEGSFDAVCGVPMYFSGHEPARNRELLSAFQLIGDDVVTITEPEGPMSFHWILARR